MKYTILGFSQEKLIEFNLDLDEILILRYFIDFKDSGSMYKEYMEDDMYYWVEYENITKEYPILNISKDRVYRKLKNLVKNNILKHKTKKNKGTYSFYAVGDSYYNLISKSSETTNSTVKITEGYGKNNGGGTVKITEGYGKNNGTNNPSTKQPSTNNNPSTKQPHNNSTGCSENDESLEVARKFEAAGFGTVNYIILEKLEALREMYTKQWVLDAIETSVMNGKYKLSYVEGILQNWKANGKNVKAGDKDGQSYGNNKSNTNKYKIKANTDTPDLSEYDLSGYGEI